MICQMHGVGAFDLIWRGSLQGVMDGGLFVKTTPQMTRFRDAKVCNNLATYEIDDHRIQSDYKCTIGLQNSRGKNSVLGIVRLRGETEHDANDNVTIKGIASAW